MYELHITRRSTPRHATSEVCVGSPAKLYSKISPCLPKIQLVEGSSASPTVKWGKETSGMKLDGTLNHTTDAFVDVGFSMAVRGSNIHTVLGRARCHLLLRTCYWDLALLSTSPIRTANGRCTRLL